jgi:hypothetical protein
VGANQAWQWKYKISTVVALVRCILGLSEFVSLVQVDPAKKTIGGDVDH